MTYFTADEILTAKKFFTNRIYVDFGGYGKYADECTYEDLKDYIFDEFVASEDDEGNAEVLVELTTVDELKYRGYEYDDEGNIYDDGEKVFDVEQYELTFDDIYYGDMFIDRYFTVDVKGQKITVN